MGAFARAVPKFLWWSWGVPGIEAAPPGRRSIDVSEKGRRIHRNHPPGTYGRVTAAGHSRGRRGFGKTRSNLNESIHPPDPCIRIARSHEVIAGWDLVHQENGFRPVPEIAGSGDHHTRSVWRVCVCNRRSGGSSCRSPGNQRFWIFSLCRVSPGFRDTTVIAGYFFFFFFFLSMHLFFFCGLLFRFKHVMAFSFKNVPRMSP